MRCFTKLLFIVW